MQVHFEKCKIRKITSLHASQPKLVKGLSTLFDTEKSLETKISQSVQQLLQSSDVSR